MNYKDYGMIHTEEPGARPQVPIEEQRTQVYRATHDSKNLRLPYMNRSFISFNYGGKWIEDFNLIAVFKNDRLEGNLYAEFDDNVTESEVFDGQIYWSSHYKAKTLEFTLATDGITQRQLDDFRHWFCPGIIRNLILAEHPNRVIAARISQPPVMSFIPFEHKISFMGGATEYETSTTLYRGEIQLSFVMDEPYWHSIVNMLDKYDEDNDEYKIGYWDDANGQEVIIADSKDALKISYEDQIPFSEILNIESVGGDSSGVTVGQDSQIVADLSDSAAGSQVGHATVGMGHVAIRYMTKPGTGQTGHDEYMYFYYPGTAPCRPQIELTYTPSLQSGYIASPWNKNATTGINNPPYNTITVQSVNTYQLKFSLPNILNGYNQVIKTLNSGWAGKSWPDLEKAINDNVKHYAPRDYILYLIGEEKGNSVSIEGTNISNLISNMQNFLKYKDENESEGQSQNESQSEDTINSFTIIFDCQNGVAKGSFTFRGFNNGTEVNKTIVNEDVSDMVKSNYLILRDRNVLSENGQVCSWTEEHPEYSYRLSHDLYNTASISINYDYLYL